MATYTKTVISSVTQGSVTRSLRITYNQVTNPSKNQSTVTITKLEVNLQGGFQGWLRGKILINGTIAINAPSGAGSLFTTPSGDGYAVVPPDNYSNTVTPVTVNHDNSGSASVSFTFQPVFSYTNTIVFNTQSGNTYSLATSGASISSTLEPIPIFTLSIDAINSTITVNRTSSSVGAATGALSNGAKIFTGDTLSVSRAPNSGYTGYSTDKLGNSITVSGDVSLKYWSTRKYTLSITTSNATITVTKTTRNSYGLGAQKNATMSNGDALYEGDVISVTRTPNTGYTTYETDSSATSFTVTNSNISVKCKAAYKYTLSITTENANITVTKTTRNSYGLGKPKDSTMVDGDELYAGDVLSFTKSTASGYTVYEDDGKTSPQTISSSSLSLVRKAVKQYTLSISSLHAVVRVTKTAPNEYGVGDPVGTTKTRGSFTCYSGDRFSIIRIASAGYSIYSTDAYGSSVTILSSDLTVFASAAQNYYLTINAYTGSIISVARIQQGYQTLGGIGSLSNGDRIWRGDVLKIIFTAQENYAILTQTVNGNSFVSGRNYIVSADTTIATTAQILGADVAATDVVVGNSTSITVTQYNTSYFHSIAYSFGALSGYIASDGSFSSTEQKYQTTSIATTIPDSWYAQFLTSQSAPCTLTITTYPNASSTTPVGNPKTATFQVRADPSVAKPTISCSVVDINATTLAVTGDSSVLIAGKSTAQATVTATPRKNATISRVSVNGTQYNENPKIVSLQNTMTSRFVFDATDSRGLSAGQTIIESGSGITWVNYIQLTLLASGARLSPTSNTVSVYFNGSFYNGNFGSSSRHNGIKVYYRFKESGGSYGSYTEIPSTEYTISSNSFSCEDFQISNLLYTKNYTVEISAQDGVGDAVLTNRIYCKFEFAVLKGVPVFDWGENDFQFHVPVFIEGAPVAGITDAEIDAICV